MGQKLAMKVCQAEQHKGRNGESVSDFKQESSNLTYGLERSFQWP